uniref:thrombopoietin isoform X3 n=1 Tax=Semicossyphus pulcher TaxID=241346 RepID=UPI0037E740EA
MRRWEIIWLRRQKGHTAPLQRTQGIFHLATFLNGTNVDSSGAAEQGMALSRLLLLCVVASKVWDAETKPVEFVCNKSARRALNIVAEVEAALHQEKRGDIVASLRLLVEGVEVVRAQSQPGCAASLLQRLENNINNYLLILRHLQLNQGPAVSPTLSCVPRSTQSLSTVLMNYNQLVSGKLERLMVDLEGRCTS